MRKSLVVSFISCAFFSIGIQSQAAEPLELVQSIPLPHLHDGDFDHFTADLAGHRLFLTAEKNGAVEVFDLRTNKLIHSIADFDEPHSMVYRPDLDKLFVVDGGAAELKIYRADSYEKVGSVKLEDDCDSMAYDPVTKYMYIVNGGRGAHTPYSFISIVDIAAAKKLADIKIDTDRVEALALEKSGPRLFVNLTGLNSVGVIDRKKQTLTTTWSVAPVGQQNVPLVFDEADHRLFLVTGKPPTFVVLDSDSGAIVASASCVAMVDDLAYDRPRKRLYASGNEFIDVLEQKDADHYTLIGHVPSAFRAKTAILIPELDRYYLAVPGHEGKPAEVRVYKVMP